LETHLRRQNADEIFYLDSKIIEQIEARADNRSETVNTNLEFYYLLRRRAPLKALLTDGELYLICDAMNGTMIDAMSVKYLRHEIVDAIELNSLDSKHGVDKHALDKKFAHMTLTDLVALADAVRIFWSRVGKGENNKSPSEMGILD
jgi:hypothetical protein